MANAKYDYSKILKIAEMSVDDYKKEFDNGGFLGMGGKSDEEIQEIIDSMKEAVETKSNWSKLSSTASKTYEDLYADAFSYLKLTANVSEEQRDSIYNAAVSDNYADGTKMGDDTLSNVTIDAGDGTQADWSETQVMKKTRLENGTFRNTDESGKELDDFSGENIGVTRTVAGGTITNLGIAQYGFGESVDVDDKKLFYVDDGKLRGSEDYQPLNDTQKGTMVHYEGYLGSFDYNTRDFEIAYYETEVAGNKISVPTLHYIGDGGVSLHLHAGQVGITDGSKIVIPKGIINADYMFADNQNVTSVPALPNTLTSAHGMFLNCKNLKKGCDAISNEDGTMNMPSKLKDISWMFYGCENMTSCFKSFSENLLDARYAFAYCDKLGYDPENITDETLSNTFYMPDMDQILYANPEYLRNMFDGISGNAASVITVANDKNDGIFGSAWTKEDGAHNNNYDKLENGSYDEALETAIEDNSSKSQILRMMDKKAKGMTGLESDTGGLATEAVQITDEGTFADNSTWAKFMQDDFSGTYHQDNQFGEILDHAIPVVGTYAISKTVLNKLTNGHFKGVTTLGAVALAAVPQVVGFGNKLTPMLDWTANAVGSDTKVGQFLSNLSDKLKGTDINYSTKVEELNANDTFDKMQESAVKYATNQVSGLFKTTNADIDRDGVNESIFGSTQFNYSTYMAENGKKIANDANLLFIACEPEENVKNTMSDSVVKTLTESLHSQMDDEISQAAGDEEKLQAISEKYSGYYQALCFNLSAYNDAAINEVNNVYMNSPELKDQAMNGLEKVMRTTGEPLYTEMKALQDEWKSKYGIDFFSDKQLNDSTDELSIKNTNIAGLGKFADFDPNKDYSDQSDTYVEKLETYQIALANAITNASSQEEIDAAYASYYETAYGWALDEAEKHGVVLDKRGAQTTSEKNSFSEQVALLETAKKEELVSGKTSEKETDIIETKETQTEKSAASEEVINDTDSQEFMSEKRVAQYTAAGLVTESPDINTVLYL